MPFSVEEFYRVFADYNAAVWPAQVLAYLLGLTAVALTLRGTQAAARAILAILAAMWLLNGVGYHWLHFSRINPAAWVFGAAFVVQAALLLRAALRPGGIRFGTGANLPTALAALLIAYALVLYPLVGWLAGHGYPAVPVFGIAPCPTTIFTIGLLLLAPWRAIRGLLVVPVLWSGIGGSAALLLGVPQDYGLIAAGLLVLALAAARRRRPEEHRRADTA